MNWKAADYTTAMGRQTGRVHIMAADGERSRCGKTRALLGGGPTTADETCKACLLAAEAEQKRERNRERWDRESVERKALAEAERAAWWSRYDAYLLSPKWRATSAAVIRRANGICEACGTAKATQAHHVTYAHVFDEPLFDLRAVCHPCHERITEMDRRRYSRRVGNVDADSGL